MVLQSFGMTPQSAAIAYAVVGVAPMAVQSVLLNKAVNAETAARVAAGNTYKNVGIQPKTDLAPFMEAEADFAGHLGSVRNVSEGTLTEHMVDAALASNLKSVYGGHDMLNFQKVIDANNGVVILKTETSLGSGIFEVKYTLPSSTKPQIKTVYDPVQYPYMPSLTSAAAQKALAEYRMGGYTGSKTFAIEVGGVKFSVPVNPTSKTDLTPKVPTVFPIGRVN